MKSVHSIVSITRGFLFWFVMCCLLAFGVGLNAHAQAPQLNFTLETQTNDGQSVIPRLTWTTTPAASSCLASGAWLGDKQPVGVELLEPVTTSRLFTLTCNWPGSTVVAIAWQAPTQNTDGSALTNLAGFRVQYGNAADALTQSVYVQDPAARSWTSPTLAPGQWFFGVRAFNSLGLEGPLSNIASRASTAGSQQQRALELAIRFPGPPVIEE